MSLWSFLLDRALYIALYAGFGVATVIIVQLDLFFSGASLKLANIAYLWLLGMVGLFAFLMADYRRQAGFFRRLEGIDRDESLDRLGLLAEPSTLEQRIFANAWAKLYSRLRAELVEERSRGRQNVHLVSQWAHHMKGPVSVVDLELQKARQMEMRPELAEVLRSVAEENQRLSSSIQMLLNMVRLEDFAADFTPEKVDLLGLVRQLINDNRRMFITHRVFPRIVGDDGGEANWPRVVSDSKWLRFALQQVLSNAIKYSSRPESERRDSGGERESGEVTFACRRGDVEGEIVLEIEDNGIGIVPEDLGRVFNPFFTGLNGRAFPQSTGMGLYLAKQACQRLGHRISIESSPGKGTRVSVRFSPDQTIFAGVGASLAQR
ncbi:MAG: sensor histidine kinase [Bacteroidota bacterium]